MRERLWQDLKAQLDVFDARARSSLAGLKNHVAEVICAYTDAAIASLTEYAYVIHAVKSLPF